MPGEAGAAAPLRPLRLLPGCNTDGQTIREQLRVNVRRDIPWLEVQPENDKILSIVAGGPSLNLRWPEIEGDVLALNNTYGYLLERGVVPDYFMLLDARPENVCFLKGSHQTRHFIAGQCHPAVFDALQGLDTVLFLTILPGAKEIASEHRPVKVQVGGSVGTVGFKALPLAYALGYRKLVLYGYDSSHAGHHHAYSQPLNDGADTIDVYLEGRRYVTTPTLANQATEFPGFAKELVSMGCDIELRCSGLLPDMMECANRRGEIPLERREREKYQEMWGHEAYRKDAPGSRFAYKAVKSLGMPTGSTVIDYGCGTGRGAATLKQLGMSVTGVDFAPNALEVEIPFVEACLWELPEIESDYAYCTDVMEHIPQEKVEAVLEGIAWRTRKGAFFNIATRGDNLGGLIGRKLHMTVLTAGGWKELLSKHWAVEMQEGEGEATFVCTYG